MPMTVAVMTFIMNSAILQRFLLHASTMTRAVEQLTTSSRPNSSPGSRDMNFGLFEHFGQQKKKLIY